VGGYRCIGNRWQGGYRCIGNRAAIGNRLTCGVTVVTAVTDIWGWWGQVAAPGVGEPVFAGGVVALDGFAVEFERAGFDVVVVR